MEFKRRVVFVSLFVIFLSGFVFAAPGAVGGANGGGKGHGGGPSPSSPGAPSRSMPRKTPSSSGKTLTQSFNGMRVSATHEEFRVAVIEPMNESLKITFTIPIDPKTLTNESIFINGSPLNKETEIRFNKTGKCVEVRFSLLEGRESLLELKNVKAFDGSELVVTSFPALLLGKKQKFNASKKTAEALP